MNRKKSAHEIQKNIAVSYGAVILRHSRAYLLCKYTSLLVLRFFFLSFSLSRCAQEVHTEMDRRFSVRHCFNDNCSSDSFIRQFYYLPNEIRTRNTVTPARHIKWMGSQMDGWMDKTSRWVDECSWQRAVKRHHYFLQK